MLADGAPKRSSSSGQQSSWPAHVNSEKYHACDRSEEHDCVFRSPFGEHQRPV